MSWRPTVRQLMRDEALREQLRAADLVFAHDFDGSELLVQGYDACQFVLSTGWPARMRVLRVDVDSRTDDLDWLAVVVRTVKDVERCDFEEVIVDEGGS